MPLPDQPSLDRHAEDILAGLDASGLRRQLVPTERLDGARVRRGGKILISFSGNDYLNLSGHPAVIEALVAATRRYGAGAGASRLVSGDHALNGVLEGRLAALKGTAACCLFGSGYLANVGTIPALVGAGDLVLVDELAHSCLFAGAQLSGARLRRFRHNDFSHVRALLGGEHRRALIVTDRVFSMDGDLAPTAELAAVAAECGAWLLTDDAHGFAVLPPDAAPVDVRMGTLSKAIGGYGGYVCGSAAVVELLRNRARSFVYSTGLPPGTVAAAIAALDVIAVDSDYAARPMVHARAFAAAVGLGVPASPIVPVVLGEAGVAVAAAERLEEAGFYAAAIRPPTVPAGTARLRLTFCALHEEGDVARLAGAVGELMAR